MYRYHVNYLTLLIILAILPAGCAGCDDEQPETFVCPGDGECTPCDSQSDCDDETYCHEDEGICVATECTPGDSFCEGSNVVTCDSLGSGYQDPIACSTGVCQGGQCSCSDTDDCAPGSTCTGGQCRCPSSVTCGQNGACCGDGETCAEVEVCEDGDCEDLSLCQPECEGSVCGITGDLCCEGDTPECGPDGQCAPSCEGQGELCGEDFDHCCEAGDLCVFGDCRTPGDACETFSECDFDEYCDPGLGRCMSDDFPEDLVCEMEFDFDDFESEVLWHWTGTEINGSNYGNVMMTPMVADMTGNGVPNPVFNAYNSGSTAYTVVIDGDTGETIYVNSTRDLQFGTQLALVDITKDGLPEIVVARGDGVGVIRNIVDCPDPENDPDGCYRWWNGSVSNSEGSPVVADMNANEEVEIILNASIVDGLTGETLAVSPSGGYDYTAVADITGDGRMEFLAGDCLYAVTDDDDDMLDELWCNEAELPGGSGQRVYVAVGDLVQEDGRAGSPEFILAGDGNVYVVAAESGALLHEFDLPGGGLGGAPIIADFDGDGSAEFGIAGQGCYTVFDLDCLGSPHEDYAGCMRPEIESCEQGVDCFEVEMCPALSETGGTGDGILWSVYTQDISSSRTGSSVFDFMGNGRNEVVYNDECLLMVLDGQTGSPRFRYPNTTRTSSEYPIIVDVNGDSRTNIVVIANNDQFDRDCRDPIQDRPDRYPECHGDGSFPDWCTEGMQGVLALQDPEDRWVRTRKIWNQYAYHIDNVTDEAQAPSSPTMPWETHNTFRANRQGEVPLNAPDVVISSVQTNAAICPPDIDFLVTVKNNGMSAIPPGLSIALYDIDTNQILETIILDQPLSPGGTVSVPFSYTVPQSRYNQNLNFMFVANEDGLVRDCNPDTATAIVDTLQCYIPG